MIRVRSSSRWGELEGSRGGWKFWRLKNRSQERGEEGGDMRNLRSEAWRIDLAPGPESSPNTALEATAPAPTRSGLGGHLEVHFALEDSFPGLCLSFGSLGDLHVYELWHRH
jgi:hypothetical protein